MGSKVPDFKFMEEYFKLFQIRFYQEYLKGYSINDLDLLVPQETRVILKSYQLLIRKTNEGFFVFVSKKSQSLLKYLKSYEKLLFGVRVKKPFFAIVSELLVNDPIIKYFLTNTGDELINSSRSDSSENLLHKKDFISESEQVAVVYPYSQVSSLFGESRIQITSGEKEFFSGNVDNQKFSFLISDNFGFYQINNLEDDRIFKFFYTPPELSQAFMLLQITINSEIFEEIKNNGVFYTLRFSNRLIKWNYLFVPRTERVVKDVQVMNGKNHLNFSPIEKIILPNNKVAFKISSLELLPVYKTFTDLKMVAQIQEKTDQHSEETKRLKLPTPEINRLKGIRIEGKEIYYSDMYIYY